MSSNMIKVMMLYPFHQFVNDKKKSFTITFNEGDTFEDLTIILTNMFGDEFTKLLLDEDNKIHDHISVMKDGSNITSQPDCGFSVPLKNNQEYVFCSFIPGG